MQWTVAEKAFSEQGFRVVFQFTFKKNFPVQFREHVVGLFLNFAAVLLHIRVQLL